MPTPGKKRPTGAESSLRERLGDREYASAYRATRARIAQVDEVIRGIDARRRELGMTKAELGRRSGLKPEAVRRLLTTGRPNPTLATLVSLAQSLDLVVAVIPMSWDDWEAQRFRQLRKNSRRRRPG